MPNSTETIADLQQHTLDPENWDALQGLGHRMLDDMFDHLRTVRKRPVWQPVPDNVKANFESGPPAKPIPAERAYEEFKQNVLPYTQGSIHPRFWGWVIGSGTPFGMLAELLTAGLNTNSTFGDTAATRLELQVLDWFKELFGFPRDASGLLVSGASEANLVALAVARHAKSPANVKRNGVQGLRQRLRVYGSSETHSSVIKSLELLGLGSRSFVATPTNRDFTVDVETLRRRVIADRVAGECPICVVGNAGTVNTGAMDDLEALADLCGELGLWFHVDGAFGGLAVLAPKLKPLVAGLERSDSVAFDLHKWLHIPYAVGAVLVRDAAQHHATFASSASYLGRLPGGITDGPISFNEYGPELSRGFRGLRAWLTIKEQGFEKLGRLIEQNVDQARYLAMLVEQTPELQLLAPVSLNIVCFRFVAPDLDAAELDALNTDILVRLQESGSSVPSHTRIGDRFAIRVCVTNHRSRLEDFDLLAREVTALGRERLAALHSLPAA